MIGFLLLPGAGAADLLAGPLIQAHAPGAAWIVWESASSDPVPVAWGEADALDRTVRSTAIASEGGTWIHEAALEDLPSDARIAWRIGDDGEVHDWIAPSEDRERATSFAVLADTQIDLDWPDVLAEIADPGVLGFAEAEGAPGGRPDFVLVAGDIVSDGQVYAQWTDFLGAMAPLAASTPILPVYGNHDGASGTLQDWFHLPSNGLEDFPEHAWWFDRGNVRVIGLDSVFPWASPAEEDWLDEVLDDACGDDDVDFAVAILHHPWVNEVWPDGDTAWVAHVVEALDAFAQDCGKPAVHLFGHTHAWARGQSRDARHVWVNASTAAGNIDHWGEYDNQVDLDEYSVGTDHWGFAWVDAVAGPDPSLRIRHVSRGDEVEPRDNEVLDDLLVRRHAAAPARPQGVAPRAGQAIAPGCVTLAVTPFCDPDDDGYGGTHWQVAASCAAFDAPWAEVWRQDENRWQGEDRLAGQPIHATAIDDVPPGDACFRVRYRDRSLTWSAWSTPVAFTVSGAAAVADGTCEPDLALAPAEETDDACLLADTASGSPEGCGCAAGVRAGGLASLLAGLLAAFARRRPRGRDRPRIG